MKCKRIGAAITAIVLLAVTARSIGNEGQPVALDVKATGDKTFYVDGRAGNNQVSVFSQSTLEDFTVVCNKVQAALDAANPELPHYKQVRAFHVVDEAFTIDSGLLTANGKLKRDLIAQRFRSEIDAMYRTAQTA